MDSTPQRATRAAQHFGKRLEPFFKTVQTCEYISELEQGLKSSLHKNVGSKIVESFGGNRYMKERGTWAHIRTKRGIPQSSLRSSPVGLI